jgi:hypothetical protein
MSARTDRPVAGAQAQERGGGHEEAERVGDDRRAGAEDLHERAAQRRPARLGGRAGRLQLAVALDQPFPADHRRQDRLVADVEQDRRHAGQQRDDEELRERQHAGQRRDRDAREQGAPHDVRADHHRTPPHPVEQDPGGQPDQQERGGLRRRQQAHLPRCRGQGRDRQQRQRDAPDVRTDLADGLARPQQQEVPMAPQTHRTSVRH